MRFKVSLCLFLVSLFSFSPIGALADDPANNPNPPITTEFNVSEGTHVVDASTLSNIAALTVSQGATAVINFSNTANLSVLGNIANSGSIYAYSSNPAVSTANFTAQNIYNNQGAVLSTVLPASILGTLTNVNSNLSLNLSAINNIVNAGTISSSGALSMSAGSIANTGIMQALQAVNLSTATLVNSGTIASLTSNVNIASMMSQNLLVNNTHGSIQALLGNINMSTSSSGIEKLLLSIMGGDVRAQALNLLNPNGSVEVNIGKLDGMVNVEACSAHVTASTQTLNLGSLKLTGDPTFYNTGGDIIISSDIDLRPVNFTAPGAVALAIVAYGNISAANGVTKIDISTVPNNINSGNWPGDQNAGSLLILAGAPNFNATPTDNSAITWSAPAPPAPIPYPGDNTNTLTIYNAPPTGASQAIGGNINMTNVNLNTQAGYPGQTAISGNVTLVSMSGLSNSGNISIGNITTGESTPTTADNTGLNGNVTIIAAGNVTTGNINTSGNSTSSSLYNGNVTIYSAGVKFLQSTLSTSGFTPQYALITQTLVPAGTTTFAVDNPPLVGQTLYLDPMGPASEKVVVSNVNGSTVTVSSPFQNNHVASEQIYTDAAASSAPGNPLQIVINPGAGTVATVPMTQNGGAFAPDISNIQNGQITTGTITSGGFVTIVTGGTITATGNISLTQNPTQLPSAYLRYPEIILNGTNGVTVNSNVIVSSEIANCTLCFNRVNVITESLTNGGTIQGFVVNIYSPSGQGMTVQNNGTITGGATNGGAAINAFVKIYGDGGMQFSGTGTIQTPGVVSVIEIAVGDGNLLTFGSSHTITTGTQGLVILDAQRSGGNFSLGSNSVLTFSGSPTVIINSPLISFANGSAITGPSVLAMGSGLAVSTTDGLTPVNMVINLSSAATATITATNIGIRPMDGATITLQADGGGATLDINGSTQITAQAIADIQIDTTLTINFNGSYQRLGNPSGGITGIAFQPYVGPYISPPVGYTDYASYSYQQVLAMLGPVAASQQFQAVSTYTDGIAPPPYSSTVYVIQAAKEIGLKVSAGVFITMDNSGAVTSAVDSNGNPIDLVPTLNAAALYGNVMDIVMGNEDIVGGANPENSIATLTGLISNAQTLRNGINNPITSSNYTSTTLPVTTRQVGGVYDIVTWGSKTPPNPTAAANMVALLNQVDGYVYGNFYPFFNNDVIAALTCPNCTGYAYSYIGMNATQAQFSELVETNMTAQYSKVALDVQNAGVSNKIRIGETGWAQQGITQASPTYANYYYQAMQDWSSKNGVPINDYFDGYNEPWKPTDKGPPGSTITLTAATNIGDTTFSVSNPAELIGVSQIVIYPPPQRVTASTPPPYIAVAYPEEFANIQPQSGAGSNPWQLFSPLQNPHNAGDIVNVGQGSEPYFGVFIASGTSPGGPGYAPAVTYQLNSISQQVNLPLYLPTALPPATTVAQEEAAAQPPQMNFFLSSANTVTNNESSLAAKLGGSTIPTDQNPERLEHSLPQHPDPQFTHGETHFNLALSTNQVFYGAENNNGHISLPSGNGLFAAKSNLNIQTKLGNIKVDPGAVVLVLQNQHGVMVYNLYDERSSSVHVDVGNTVAHVSPGKQLFLTDNNYDSLEEISPSEISYRTAQERRIGNIRAFSAQFSMFSALTNVQGLRGLLNSPNKTDQKLGNKLLMAAAAHFVMDKSKTPFTSPSGHGTRKISY